MSFSPHIFIYLFIFFLLVGSSSNFILITLFRNESNVLQGYSGKHRTTWKSTRIYPKLIKDDENLLKEPRSKSNWTRQLFFSFLFFSFELKGVMQVEIKVQSKRFDEREIKIGPIIRNRYESKKTTKGINGNRGAGQGNHKIPIKYELQRRRRKLKEKKNKIQSPLGNIRQLSGKFA